MKRILVIGCSGSGTTPLARWLAARLKLPLIVLDQAYWGPGGLAPTARTLAHRDAWVMDGTYHASLADRLPSADAVVWLDFDRWRCVLRALWRFDREFLRYVWSFNEEVRPRIGSVIAASRHPQVVVLRSPAEVSRFRKEFRLPA